MTNPTKASQENNLAVASLILGIISVVGFGGALTGIPAMITGFMSLKNPTNKNLGIIGLILGAVATGYFLFWGLFLYCLLFCLAQPLWQNIDTAPNTDIVGQFL